MCDNGRLITSLHAEPDLLRKWKKNQNESYPDKLRKLSAQAEAAGGAICAALEDHATFADFCSLPRRMHIGSVGYRLDKYRIASLLIERVIGGTDPGLAVSELGALLTRGSAGSLGVFAVAGITADRRSYLAEGGSIMPPSDLPDSILKDRIFGISGSDYILTPRPSAALVIEHQQMLFPDVSASDDDPATKSLLRQMDEQFHEADRILACIMLTGDCAPLYVAHYGWLLDPAWPSTGFGDSPGVNYNRRFDGND